MAPKTLIFILLMLVSTTIIHTCSAQTDKKFPAILTFGDSTLDTGNNDFLETLFKANYKPYGKDFPGQVPTGRFSNGKLASDILASLLKIKETVPPFLDPNLSNDELGTGVNFASAGSGYDELTTSVSGVIPVKNQTQYFEDYIKRLKGVVGEEKAKNIIEGALVIVSAGSNDLVFNYYSLAGSRRQLSITQYHDFLLQRVQDFLKAIYDLGSRKIVVAGLPPIGCLPIQITASFKSPSNRTCLTDQNSDSQAYNSKLETLLGQLEASFPGSKFVYANLFDPVMDMINNPQKYGFVETNKGCCGSGFFEAGPLCNALACSTTIHICNAQINITFTAVLIFGDSTMDTGNNNYVNTPFKGNHIPYGQDFPGKVPTGRFSDGKLVPDMVASLLKIKETVPPFLDPKITDNELKTGVTFASAASGYDDLTSVLSQAIPVSKQPKMFKKYIERLKGVVGELEAMRIVNGALVVVSSGTNDFCFNFYDVPSRRIEFSSNGYQDFLLKKVEDLLKKLYNLGGRTMVIAGLPPMGCLPIQMSTRFELPGIFRVCLEDQNSDAQSYNSKLEKLLPQIQNSLPGSKILYVDIYTPLDDMINNPEKYGFVETKRGCCGTGLVEAGPLCNSLTPVCENASQYVFWDSIHPTEAAYRVLVEYLEKDLSTKIHNSVGEKN
ncbi:unnamed protein product, partial [Vitis vinifera]